MTSQSPREGGTPPTAYFDAWVSMRYLVLEQGLSWSGRERDHLFLNAGDGTFADLSGISGADDIGDGRALAVLDWDGDGRLDLLLKSRTAPRLRLFHNRLTGGGRWLALELAGAGKNRDAIGARVEVDAGGRTLRATVRAGEGYLAQSSRRLHFGLGTAEAAERVRIAWPDGARTELGPLAAGARYAVRQGDSEARAVPAAAPVALRESEAEPRGKKVRVPLIEKLPLAALELPGLDGRGDATRTVADLAGRPVLVDLWSTTCAACVKEFGAWRERRDELDRRGLRIVALGTDLAAERATGLAMLERFGLAADAGVADERFLEALGVVLEEVVGPLAALPLPTSLLLDERGQLVVLYLGPAEVDVLLGDLDTLAKMKAEQSSSARLLDGVRMIPRERDLAALAQRFRQIGRDDLAGFYRDLAAKR